MKKYKVAILGATGAVGETMVRILEERNFPIKELRLLASTRSAGKSIVFRGKSKIVESVNEHSFDGIDIVLSAVSAELSKKYVPLARSKGAIVIDNSSAFRMDPEVPLIIPEVNVEMLDNHKGIIANPNCSTIIALMAVAPLHIYATITRMIMSTYQAVSGAGSKGIDELNDQVQDIIDEQPIVSKTFQQQIAYNVIPQIGQFNLLGKSDEEVKLQNEGRKILNEPQLLVNCTCVRVPVIRSHSESITLEFKRDIDVDKAHEILSQAKGVILLDDPQHKLYPTPLISSNQDAIYVGRIRKDDSTKKTGLILWCCGDQLRKGAATNAIQIAEALIQSGSLKI